MARRARLFVPGCVHHVMARGLDGMDIFRGADDRDTFLRLFARYLSTCGMRCYAWALIKNHYHLVVRTSELPLAALMKPLNSLYAGYFNRRYGRRGYLFQDRFKSVATQDQRYVEELVRYVHLNPVRAGECRTLDALDSYSWCGHAALMGTQERAFQDTWTVLRRFGRTPAEARRQYREYLARGIDTADEGLVAGVRASMKTGTKNTEPGMWVIGDKDFVARAMQADRQRRVRLARFAREGSTVGDVCAEVARRLEVTTEQMLRRSCRGADSDARKAAAFVAHRRMEIPVAEIARLYGVSGSAVSMMLREGERIATKSKISF